MKHKFIFCDSPSLRSALWLIYMKLWAFRSYLPWEFSVAICRGYLPWELPWVFAVGICRGYLPWEFAVGFFCLCKQTFFLCQQIFFLCKQTFFVWKQNIFLFMRVFLLTVHLFAIAMAVMGHRTFAFLKKTSYIFSGLVFFRLNL